MVEPKPVLPKPPGAGAAAGGCPKRPPAGAAGVDPNRLVDGAAGAGAPNKPVVGAAAAGAPNKEPPGAAAGDPNSPGVGGFAAPNAAVPNAPGAGAGAKRWPNRICVEDLQNPFVGDEQMDEMRRGVSRFIAYVAILSSWGVVVSGYMEILDWFCVIILNITGQRGI